MPRIATLALIVFMTACADSPTAASKHQCVGEPLLVGSAPTTGHVDPAASCLRAVPLFGDSVSTLAYALSVTRGQGYLVTMTGASTLNPKLILTTADTLLAINRGPTQIANLLFASTSTRTDTVQATAWDASPGDTGSYTIAVQSCPVRAMVSLAADSATVTDSVTGYDCQVPDSSFAIPDANLAQIHLFAVHWDSVDALRRIAFRSDVPLRLIIGGWHDDTFGGDTASILGFTAQTVTADTILWGAQTGDYTILLATDSAATTTAHYTLTIGPETTRTHASPVAPHMRFIGASRRRVGGTIP